MLVLLVVVAVAVVVVAVGLVAWRLLRRAPVVGEAAAPPVAPAPTEPSTEPTAPGAPRAPPPGTDVDPGAVSGTGPDPVVEAGPAPGGPTGRGPGTGPPDVTVPGEAPAADELAVEPVVAEPPRLRDRMGRTRDRLSGYFRGLAAQRAIDEETWESLEAALLGADVGVRTTTALLDGLRSKVASGQLRDAGSVLRALRDELAGSLRGAGDPELHLEPGATNVWLFVGVNGVGKTTTIGKLARRQVDAGCSVLLAAGDTFRAAAAEQLALWAARAEVEIVRGAEGGDPSAVVFDAVQRAAARGNDLVLADTAGRLHTKVNLVEELKKIRRVAERPPGTVTEVLLVLDATTGQNGLVQARQFLDAVGVTGVVLTKLDGTAKGGIVVAIQRELGLPVKLVGIGEGPDDLVPFDAEQFVAALFDEERTTS
ncbi:MAG: signal recognition particle-docking protein FtsY [Actinomycetota bacterium]|jgi:fused signal recognition particle receptor|nr:signal recognition particle-docking protein FtsY [Actinomycetota bacterium]